MEGTESAKINILYEGQMCYDLLVLADKIIVLFSF